jgi:hypothetical protein
MRFCEAPNCSSPVFGSCKITRQGFCRSHQSLRQDFDNRTITQRAIDKGKKTKPLSASTISKVRSLENEDKNQDTASRSNLISEIDFYVSRICRYLGMNAEGKIKCYTCDFVGDMSQLQCGHYNKREAMSTRFDNKWGTRPQCPGCNIHKHGNIEVFKKNLEEERPGITDTLYELSKVVEKLSIEDLKGILVAKREELKLIEHSRELHRG